MLDLILIDTLWNMQFCLSWYFGLGFSLDDVTWWNEWLFPPIGLKRLFDFLIDHIGETYNQCEHISKTIVVLNEKKLLLSNKGWKNNQFRSFFLPGSRFAHQLQMQSGSIVNSKISHRRNSSSSLQNEKRKFWETWLFWVQSKVLLSSSLQNCSFSCTGDH